MNVLPVHAAAVEGQALADLGARRLGVGKAAAALAMAELLAAAPPDLVLLFGVCGAYPERHTGAPAPVPGSLCLVSEDRFGDEGVQTPEGFLDLARLGLGEVGPFPMDRDLTARAAELLGAPVVRGTTVSTCSGTEESSASMVRRTGAQVETMEGAAVALACRRAGVPLVQLRAVSNYTGNRDRGEWALAPAAAAVQAAARTLLEALRG